MLFTWDGSSELFPLGGVLDHIIIDSKADSYGKPADKQSRVFQDLISAILKVNGLGQFLWLPHNNISESNMAVLNDP